MNAESTEFLHYDILNDPIDQEISFTIGSDTYKYIPEYLMSITRLKKEEIAFIINNEAGFTNILSFSHISTIFRIASFTKAIKISIEEYYLYREVCLNANPASFEDFEAFAKDIENIKSGPFDIEMLDYLIKDSDNAYKTSSAIKSAIRAYVKKKEK